MEGGGESYSRIVQQLLIEALEFIKERRSEIVCSSPYTDVKVPKELVYGTFWNGGVDDTNNRLLRSGKITLNGVEEVDHVGEFVVFLFIQSESQFG